MGDVPISQLQQAIKGLHGCDSEYVETIRVVEEFENTRVWEGNVYVFSLVDHPTAEKCYAWAHSVGNAERQRFVAVLHEPPVDSPAKAVRAAIVAEHR